MLRLSALGIPEPLRSSLSISFRTAAEQSDFSPVFDHRTGAFHRQTRYHDQRCHGKNKLAGGSMRKQFFPSRHRQQKCQHARDQEQMLFRFHNEIVGKWPGSPEYQCLFGRVEVNVPISAADPCGGHRERSHQGGCPNPSGVPGLRTERLNEYPQCRQASRDAEPGMREKYYVAGRDVHCVSFRATLWVSHRHAVECARGIARLTSLTPSPIQTEVSVIFGLPDGGVAITEQELKSGIAKLVIAADIDQRRRSRLRRRQSFRSVIKDLDR